MAGRRRDAEQVVGIDGAAATGRSSPEPPAGPSLLSCPSRHRGGTNRLHFSHQVCIMANVCGVVTVLEHQAVPRRVAPALASVASDQLSHHWTREKAPLAPPLLMVEGSLRPDPPPVIIALKG